MLKKKSSKLLKWRDRFAVLVYNKNEKELTFYTFYSEDFREGASNKFKVGGVLRNMDLKVSKKSFLFNKDHSFSL